MKIIILIASLISALNADVLNVFSDIAKSLTEKEANQNVKNVTAWFDSKIIEIENKFNNQYLLAMDGEINMIDKVKLDNLNNGFEALATYDYKKKSMAENSNYYDSLTQAIEDITLTKEAINSIFNSYNTELTRDKQYFSIYEYANENNLKDIPHDKLASYQLKKMFFAKYPQQEKYILSLDNFELKLNEFSNEISNYSYDFEEKLFLKKIQKINSNIKSINDDTLEEMVTGDNFEPQNNILYRLGSMKTFQSTSNGFLAHSQHDKNLDIIVFIESSKKFVDNKVFDDTNYYVTYKGIMQYKSLLGTKKTIHSFKLVDVKNDYYFFE